MTDISPIPTRLSIVSQALGEFKTAWEARRAENKSLLDRGEELLQRILGEAAKHATLDDDFDGVLFELDDMQLLFTQGATPEDDYFQVSLFGMEHSRAFRTLAGLGKALDEVIAQLRLAVEYVNEQAVA